MKLSACDAQDVIDVLGIDKQVRGQVTQPQPDDVAILAHGRGQEAELIAQVVEGVSQTSNPPRAGGSSERFPSCSGDIGDRSCLKSDVDRG